MGRQDANLARAAKHVVRDQVDGISEDTLISEDIINQRRLNTEYEAEVIRRMDHYDAAWIAEGLGDADWDSDLIGGIQVVSILRTGIEAELKNVQDVQGKTRFTPELYMPYMSGPAVLPLEYNLYELEPQDLLVLRARNERGGEAATSGITEVDVAATLIAENTVLDESTLLTPRERRSAIQDIVEEETFIGYQADKGFRQLADFLIQRELIVPGAQARIEAAQEQAVTAYLEAMGMWDPSEVQRKKYGSVAREWIQKFQLYFYEQLVNRIEGSNEQPTFNQQQPLDRDVITRVGSQAEDQLQHALQTFLGEQEYEAENIELKSMGAEFFRALVTQPDAVLTRMEAYRQSQKDGIDVDSAYMLMRDFAREKGEVIVATQDIHRKPPELSEEEKTVNNRILYATHETLRFSGLQVSDMTAEEFAAWRKDVEVWINEHQKEWEGYADYKYNALKEQGIAPELAASITQRDIIKLVNEICDEDIQSIDHMGYVYYLEMERNGAELAKKLQEIGKTDEVLADQLVHAGQRLMRFYPESASE